MATKKEVGASISYLLAGYPNHKMGEQSVKAYVDDLADIDGRAVFGAAKMLRKQSKFFPSIAEWREVAKALENAEIRSQQANAKLAADRQLEAQIVPLTPEQIERNRRLVEDLIAKCQMDWPKGQKEGPHGED
jgi:hypothetical protein